MQITSPQHAKRLVPDYERHTSVVVSETGDVYINGNVVAVTTSLKNQGKSWFILKGQIEVKKSKTKKNAKTE